MKIWCPRCDQGWIRKYRHAKTMEVVFICEECEALWRERESIEKEGSQDFQAYFESKGHPGNWKDMTQLDDDGKGQEA